MKIQLIEKVKNKIASAIGLCICISLLQSTAIAGVPRPGTTITAGNAEQYAETMPPWMVSLFKNEFGFLKPINVTIKEAEPNEPPEKYKKASEKNIGTVKLDANGELENYVSGLPFPDPKEPDLALKIMWNQYYRWQGDDYMMDPDIGKIISQQRKGGEVQYNGVQNMRLKFSSRTDTEPLPSLNNPQDLFYGYIIMGVGQTNPGMQLIYRYNDSKKDDDLWAYIPPLRRTIRMVSSERSNPIGGSVKTWDDLMGFDGRIIDFTYSLEREQVMIGLTNQKTRIYDPKLGDHPPHPILDLDPWEAKEGYIIKVVPKDPSYPNSHRFLWIVKESATPLYATVFDRNAKLWKGFWNATERIKTEDGQYGPFINYTGAVDFKTDFWYASCYSKALINSGIPPARFSKAAMGRNMEW